MKNKYSLPRFLVLLLMICTSALQSCDKDTPQSFPANPASAFNANVPLEWNKLFLEIDRYAPGYRPPAAARMLAYTGLAAYESAVGGMQDFNSMKAMFPDLNLPPFQPNKKYYHWPASVNAAYAEMFRFFYPHITPDLVAKINALEKKFEDEFKATESSEIMNQSVDYGRSVAQAVINWSKTDLSGHDAYLNPYPSYHPPVQGPNGEYYWQPTLPDYTPALFPFWGNVRSFAMQSNDLLAKPPLTWSANPNSSFYSQALEISAKDNSLTFEEQWVVEFWSNDIFGLTFEPAGRWISIANQIIEDDSSSLQKAVLVYAQLGMALGDVGIAVWKSKYHYNVERPVQYIQRVINPNWRPYLNDPINNLEGITPPSPSYPSEHAGFSGAGAAILIHAFGERAFADKSLQYQWEINGTPRNFPSFTEAALECAYSRMVMGAHYRMDCTEGMRLGQQAAQRVTELPWRKN